MKLDNKTYDVLAWIGRILLPALATLWLSMADVWGLPYKVEIATTIVAVDTFLNTLLGISSANYYKEIADKTKVVDENKELG